MDDLVRILDGEIDHAGTKAGDRAELRKLNAIDERSGRVDDVVHGLPMFERRGLDPEVALRVAASGRVAKRRRVVRQIGQRGTTVDESRAWRAGDDNAVGASTAGGRRRDRTDARSRGGHGIAPRLDRRNRRVDERRLLVIGEALPREW